MAAPLSDPAVAVAPPRWGLGDAIGGWLVAYVAAALIGAVILAAAGYHQGDDLSLTLIALTYPPLWLGFVGAPVWAARTKGAGVVRDFGLRVRALDVPVGAVAGVVAQVLLVPLVSLPALWLTNSTADDLSKPARELADKAVGPGGAVLFFVIVGLCAPVAEELFFRGLLLRSLEKKGLGRWWALAISSLAFAATHFQPLQFLGLATAGAVFGFLAQRSGRLGPSIVAHMAFNTTAVVALLWLS